MQARPGGEGTLHRPIRLSVPKRARVVGHPEAGIVADSGLLSNHSAELDRPGVVYDTAVLAKSGDVLSDGGSQRLHDCSGALRRAQLTDTAISASLTLRRTRSADCSRMLPAFHYQRALAYPKQKRGSQFLFERFG
jgi:hypothetical protein